MFSIVQGGDFRFHMSFLPQEIIGGNTHPSSIGIWMSTRWAPYHALPVISGGLGPLQGPPFIPNITGRGPPCRDSATLSIRTCADDMWIRSKDSVLISMGSSHSKSNSLPSLRIKETWGVLGGSYQDLQAAGLGPPIYKAWKCNWKGNSHAY